MRTVCSHMFGSLQLQRLVSTQARAKVPSFGPALHEYTSGRFLFNEDLRLRERHLKFNLQALASAICTSIGRPLEELQSLEKLAEGGFNRIVQAKFSDGKEVLARLPFRLESPLQHSVSSEAATLSFLHQRGFPVPKVLGYSPTIDNAVGIEYIILEKLPGKPLGERWFSLENKAVAKIMKQIVDIEQKCLSIPMPASGSLYFRRDLNRDETFVPIHELSSTDIELGIGPIASYAWWYRERAALDIDRGPWKSFLPCFEAAAKRELAFCQNYGKPRLNVERYLRDLDNLELQDPAYHAQILQDFLRLAPYLDVSPSSSLARPTLRHPDLSPNNILVNDDNQIVGIIDWQHTVSLPLCLCAGIPHHYQNWGDPISERLQKPETKLPADYDSLDPSSQQAAKEEMRRRLVHFYYAALHLKKLEDHYDAFRNDNSMLRAKLFSRASAPWEGSSLSLEHALVQIQQHWPLNTEDSSTTNEVDCPLGYSQERIEKCGERIKQEEEKLDELDEMRAMLGIDAQGWVENDEHLAYAQEMREAMKTAFLKGCDTEVERAAVQDHFAFDDHDESWSGQNRPLRTLLERR